ncbi:hypothetical protein [Actinokineospora sp. NPDC004072]
MAWAAAGPRRWAAGLLAGLLPFFGALAIVVGAGAGRADGTAALVQNHDVDAVAPTRVTPVRQAVVLSPQHERIDPPPAIVDSGPPRRADLVAVAAPVPELPGAASLPADPPAQRGPPLLSPPQHP